MPNNKHIKNSYYMYGKHPVLAALSNPDRHVESIFCNQTFFDNHKKIIIKNKYEIVSDNKLTNILKSNLINHQGVIAKVDSIFYNDINQLNFSDNNLRLAILDQVTDPQNIGSIIRSAAAFNVKAIIIPEYNSPDENASIAKAASGTLEIIKIIKVKNIRHTMEFLKKLGFWIIGFDGKAQEYLSAKLFSDKTLMVLGSEDNGLRKLISETCDYLVKIPISENVESLNVANAAAIAFYLSAQDLT